ncbi:type II toxin-antitoxin system HicA family toxin [Rubrivirga sp. S365]|uniref:type II toxin-antitoxin system HicA family toxin n=1 Tax=Rubrivirga sp. S365 TaxID=3076080 RepID=UPI0028C9F3BE|nr:type II toxin-antitoxin system HicA family toxin [Rubrivirga sp. S365]MDT7858326.1 type II toxin-antitoxin system HicA family toxin [Rubrivirga sp. S365]
MAAADRPKLSRKHARTLAAVFERPTRGDVEWSAVVALVRKLGATVSEKRAGSRVAFAFDGRVFVIHKPHPGRELSKGSCESLRDFLRACKRTPDSFSS